MLDQIRMRNGFHLRQPATAGVPLLIDTGRAPAPDWQPVAPWSTRRDDDIIEGPAADIPSAWTGVTSIISAQLLMLWLLLQA